MGTYTPWGTADQSKRHATGIMEYSTPGHGGFHVTAKRLQQMPVPFQKHGPWFEEDCACSMVILSFPDLFKPEWVTSAKKTLADYYPDEYEAWSGTVLAPGESREKDERTFVARNVNKYVVVSALSDLSNHVKVAAQRKSDGSERFFLIPQDQFNSIPFVVDPALYREIPSWDGI